MNRTESARQLMSRVAWFALAVLLLTTVHHVYGAYVYQTPWRLHAAYVSGFTAAAILASLRIVWRGTDDAFSAIAFWLFAGVTLLIPVLTIGLFEGAYNHVVKDALYFAGASAARLNRMFPPPTYEMPNDVFFEMTGVMQVVPASLTAWFLYRLVHVRLAAGAEGSGHVHADARQTA